VGAGALLARFTSLRAQPARVRAAVGELR
jgi:hypothetical protein